MSEIESPSPDSFCKNSIFIIFIHFISKSTVQSDYCRKSKSKQSCLFFPHFSLLLHLLQRVKELNYARLLHLLQRVKGLNLRSFTTLITKG